MKKGVLVGLVLLTVMTFIATAQEEVPQEACCPSREGALGIGAWFHHEMICASLKHWPDENRALEIDFCAPSWGGQPSLCIKGVSKLSDGCILDLYMTGGFCLPIGEDIYWQRFEGSIGIEWCFPDIPQMTISLEVGASLLHYYDDWYSESFIAGGIHFHLQGL